MTTVKFENFDIELSQPLPDRPEVVLIVASDGRRTILGEVWDPFTADEHRQMDSQPQKELSGGSP
ncbi:MAG: hypothetical protein IIA98_09580 [Proteobacteria bacterium]|nr:hypothetical protein [Pseudomonadota bacterium]